MAFTESNTVEALVRDILCGGVTHHTAVGPGLARRHGALSGLGWHYLAPQHLARLAHEVLVEDHVREALIRLNPEIAAQPDRADDVLCRLRAILMGVRTDGLVKTNEEFAAWLAGERSMPFGADGEHVTVRLVDLEDVERNQYVVSTQYTVRSGANERRADLVLLVNGLPLVVIEAKTPVRSSQSWFDGATQIHDDYEPNVPELFVPNLCSVATEGKDLRYGSIGLPVDLWGPWRADDDTDTPKLERIKRTISSMLRPNTVLDLLGSYTAYATGKGKRRAKIVARYQQVEAANHIVARVVAGHPKKGLVWHFQGSGKSLLMLFAARKLRLHPSLGNPTVIIVVDRVDLDTQISSTFHAADAPNLEKADTRAPLGLDLWLIYRTFSARAAEDQTRVAVPALPDGQGGAGALSLAGRDRAIATAPRGRRVSYSWPRRWPSAASLLGRLAPTLPAFHDGRQELFQWLLKRRPIVLAEGEFDRVEACSVSDGTGSLTTELFDRVRCALRRPLRKRKHQRARLLG